MGNNKYIYNQSTNILSITLNNVTRIIENISEDTSEDIIAELLEEGYELVSCEGSQEGNKKSSYIANMINKLAVMSTSDEFQLQEIC